MAFGRFDPTSGRSLARGQAGHERQPVLADINMTPMIDIMLVLLVVFIITAPLLSHSIAMDLPKAQAAATAAAASTTPPVAVAIDAKGQLYWNGQPMPPAEMDQRFRQAAAQQPPPDIALSADQHTAYSQITAVMSSAQRAGLSRFGFVVDSTPRTQPTQR